MTERAVDLASAPPVVFIVMSTYNGERHLGEQLESLVSQTEPRWQLLVRDDGSTDGTVSLLRRYAQIDRRITLCDDESGNLGVVGSFSKLLQNARHRGAQRVMLCDQDDVWLPGKVEWTLTAMSAAEQAHPGLPLLVHSDLMVVDADNRLINGSMWAYSGINPRLNDLSRLLVQNTVTGCTAMLNAPLLERIGLIPESALMHDWWIALVASSTGKIVVLPQPTIRYRQHGSNVAGTAPGGSLVAGPLQGLATVRKSSWWQLRDRLLLRPARQAGELLQRCGPWIQASDQDRLAAFAMIDNQPWLRRKLIIVRKKIWRQKLHHNLNLWFLA